MGVAAATIDSPAVRGYTAEHDWRQAVASSVMSQAVDGTLLADETLAERLGGGDVGALEQLYERHSRAVFSLALKLLAEREAAEEIVQETFLKLWQRPDAYSPERGRLIA